MKKEKVELNEHQKKQIKDNGWTFTKPNIRTDGQYTYVMYNGGRKTILTGTGEKGTALALARYEFSPHTS